MSDIIHLLPDSVANQIAAGEVIQRPASVIKELVENALDAKATHIQTFVTDAGKSLIQVIDNGTGMSSTDARLAFERHATSKIQQATDLFALRTMGFRGEALASIAAVAQVELRTRKQSEELGTSIRIEGSRLIEQTTIGCPEGANFAVRNLFFNIPARRKFLRSNQTELTNILAEFERIALAHPDTAFTLHSEGNLMMELPPGNFRQRIISIFGSRIDSQLIPVEVDTTLAQIRGFVGKPDAARRKNARQFFFVNGRFMRHPYFAKAILTAYERLIPEGQQVPFFIQFEVDPAKIDVNIHPTKTEIKFEDDAAIFQILLAAVRESLGKCGAVPAIDFNVESRPDIPAFTQGESQGRQIATAPQLHLSPNYNPFVAPEHRIPSDFNHRIEHDAPASSQDWQLAYQMAQAGLTQDDAQAANAQPHDEQALYQDLSETAKQDWQGASPEFLQYCGRYILTPMNSGLALIDQHRAHIRILYESYLQQIEQQKASSQRLLFPEMLTLSPSESATLESLMEQMQNVGFDLAPLGGGNYSVNAVPTGTEGLSPVSLVSSILSDAQTGQADASQTIGHIVASSLARKVAIPTGQVLSQEEMRHILERLFSCATPSLTPDGVPTLVILSQEQIEKLF